LKFALAQDEDQSMKRNRFTGEQIIGILKEHEAGVSVADLCRKHGVSDASVYKWKAKFGGMDVSEAKRRRKCFSSPMNGMSTAKMAPLLVRASLTHDVNPSRANPGHV
jgi:putative transposase